MERRVLEPDPGLVKSLGMHHTLESAVADLVDNSVDAGAARVVVRFEVEGGQPVALTVVDDGRGMDEHQADEAMRLGRQRDYASSDQGHFGIGLKAASFSHADTLAVYTSPGDGAFHGRRLRKAEVQRDYSCDVLDPAVVEGELAGGLRRVDACRGTCVRWSDTRFPRINDLDERDWLAESRSRLRMHLGLLYHRMLADGRLRVEVEVYDRDVEEAGPPERVAPVDPLGFAATAVAGYPRELVATVAGAERPLRLECHVVPPKSSGPSFRLYGRDGREFQGFYIYRNDRLLQVGGWNDVITVDKTRALARVMIDDWAAVAPHIRMNPEKSGIVFSHELSLAVAGASAVDEDGVTFERYVKRAEEVLAESRKRRSTRRPVIEPSRGLHKDVRRVISAEVPLRTDEDPIEIRWRRMPADRFLELDREERTVFLNQFYRPMLTGGRTGLSDAPLVKTLVFLLTEEHFRGHHWGPRDKDLIEIWDAVLGAAVQAEYGYRDQV
ncbi:hypothetical protein GCM10012284_30550 [Mangrovihabitans endophyticus]|uniref:Histidine kinase-, DNA gyrase B-, and HSP90-like ATPase n=1 Tax=Mangrovihabitans endophyticus TaxID=1751298 RepID=A0A8J3FQ13_9ACTN|nr:hypothetical protein GCM10012284_30550 [Mangrovihabitans endophyticus]